MNCVLVHLYVGVGLQQNWGIMMLDVLVLGVNFSLALLSDVSEIKFGIVFRVGFCFKSIFNAVN